MRRFPLKYLSGRAARRAAERATDKKLIAEAEAEAIQMELEHQLVAPLLQAQDHETLEQYGWHRVAPETWVIP